MVMELVGETNEWNVDYVQPIKLYGPAPENAPTRYSPSVCIGIKTRKIFGMRDPDHISTSHV